MINQKKKTQNLYENTNSVTLPANTFGQVVALGSGVIYQNGIDIYKYIYPGGANALFAANSAITCSGDRMVWSMLSI